MQFEVQLPRCPHLDPVLTPEDEAIIRARLPIPVWVYLERVPKGQRTDFGKCPSLTLYHVVPSSVQEAAQSMPTRDRLRRDRGFVCEHMGHLIE